MYAQNRKTKPNNLKLFESNKTTIHYYLVYTLYII